MDTADTRATLGKAQARSGPLADLISVQSIALVYRLRRTVIRRQREQFGLSDTEWRVMAQLGASAPLSLNGLADLLMQDRGQLSRAVKGMVERGLVSRRRKPGGPEIELDLTDQGDILYAQMVDKALEGDAELTAGVDAAEIETAKRVIGHMIARTEAMMDEAASAGDRG